MAGLNSGLAQNVVKTALDKVFYQEFDMSPRPEDASVEDGMVFIQDTIDRAAVITEVYKGTGLWKQRAELQDVNQDTTRVDDPQTFSVLNFANSIDISKNLFDDDQHGVVQRTINDFARKARLTKLDHGFSLYRNAFTTTLTNDGAAWFSNSHTNLAGDTIDNLETAALSESSLNTLIVALAQQKDQSSVIAGHSPAVLLVPSALYKTAVQITESELRSNTANNDMNVYSVKYGIIVKQTPYIGAVAGGSDTAWFLLSRNHSAYRWVRQGIETTLNDWKLQRNNNYVYKGEFRETYGVLSYEGAIGSNGTT